MGTGSSSDSIFLVELGYLSAELEPTAEDVPTPYIVGAYFLQPHEMILFVPYVDFIGNKFILMHDNARPHTARITQQYLNDVD
nr:unnamed protein product [Callosobruchus chinensis]